MQSELDLSYLQPVAAKFGNLYLVEEFERFAANVTKGELQQLAAAYLELARREDAAPISRWIDECTMNADTISYSDKILSSSLAQLFGVFCYLADRNISPFSSREVAFIECRRVPDWSNLSSELAYLQHPAERYEKHYSEEEMDRFLGNITGDDYCYLQELANTIRGKKHAPLINEWLRQHSLTKHYEAWLVYCLVMVLDALNLNLE